MTEIFDKLMELAEKPDFHYKPFEAVSKENSMKLEKGKFYKTRDGQKVEILKTDAGHSGTESLGYNYSYHSAYYYCSAGNCGNDGFSLVSEWREPVVIDGWLNVYPDGVISSVYKNKTEAVAHTTPKCLATVKVYGKEE